MPEIRILAAAEADDTALLITAFLITANSVEVTIGDGAKD
jgi:hypothetical protein